MTSAFVTWVMRGDAYVPGALVSARSLRRVHTAAQLVCMVTEDVTAAARTALATLFDHVIEVPYLRFRVIPLRTHNQRRYYEHWMDVSFTKWHCLNLTQFQRVVFWDADQIALTNLDRDLLDPDVLQTPAAVFSSPFAQPYVKPTRSRGALPGMYNPYLVCEGHNDPVPADSIREGFEGHRYPGGARTASFTAIGSPVVLTPSREHFDFLCAALRDHQPFGHPNCNSGMDDQSIVWALHQLDLTWHNISREFGAIPWHPQWLPNDGRRPPRLFHFFGKKPWDQSVTERREYRDLDVWWELVFQLIQTQPELARWFPAEHLQTPINTTCLWCHAPGHSLLACDQM